MTSQEFGFGPDRLSKKKWSGQQKGEQQLWAQCQMRCAPAQAVAHSKVGQPYSVP